MTPPKTHNPWTLPWRAGTCCWLSLLAFGCAEHTDALEAGQDELEFRNGGNGACEGINQFTSPVTGSCYTLLDHTFYDWDTAQSLCANEGGTLAALSTLDEHADVVTRLAALMNTLGVNSNRWVWLGGRDQDPGSGRTYTWNNGEDWTFVEGGAPWWYGYPSDFWGTNADCVAMSVDAGTEGLLINYQCASFDKRILCETPPAPADPSECGSFAPSSPTGNLDIREFEGRRYHFSYDAKTRPAAQEFCEGLGHGWGLGLADDQAEEDWMHANQGAIPYWIGVAKVGADWLTDGGETPSFLNFSPNEPSGNGECVVDRWGGTNHNQWDDQPCGTVNRYVCEGPRFAYYGDHAYYFPRVGKSWIDAEQSCQALGAGWDLTRIDDYREETWINGQIAGNTWINATDIVEEGVFRTGAGAALTHTNWQSNEPNNWVNNEHCVEKLYGDGRWNDGTCDWHRYYTCKGPSPFTTTSEIPALDANMQTRDRSTYYISTEALHWESAQRFCRDLGPNWDLVTINDIHENQWLQNNASWNRWIGLNDRATEGEFVWSSGSDASHRNFYANQPDSGHSDENCVEMYGGHAFWGDWLCNWDRHFICEVSNPCDLVEAEPVINSKVSWGDSCYHLSTDTRNYPTAEAYCQDLGLDWHLVTIDNSAENDFVRSSMNHDWWIGFDDLATEGVFTWTSGSPVNFTSWLWNQPDNWNDNQHCTLTNTHGDWYDVECEYFRNFVCEGACETFGESGCVIDSDCNGAKVCANGLCVNDSAMDCASFDLAPSFCSGGETGGETGGGETSGGETGGETGGGETGGGETGGGECLTEELSCNGIDDDCNGVIDDVDIDNDGFCDCYSVGIIGNPHPSGGNLEPWLATKGITATRFGTSSSHELTQAELDQFDILIIDMLTHVYSTQEAALLATWVEAGNGLISMASYGGGTDDADRQNSLASVVGLSYAAPLYDTADVWQDHPIAAGAQDVMLLNAWHVVGSGEVFVRPSGHPEISLGTAVGLGDGAGILFGDEWIGSLAYLGSAPVDNLWRNMIQWVGPKSFCVL